MNAIGRCLSSINNYHEQNMAGSLCKYSFSEGLRRDRFVRLGALSAGLGAAYSIRSAVITWPHEDEMSELGSMVIAAGCIATTVTLFHLILNGGERLLEMGPQHTFDCRDHCDLQPNITNFLEDIEKFYPSNECPKDLMCAKIALESLIKQEASSEANAHTQIQDQIQMQCRSILDIIDTQPDLANKASIRLFWQLLIEELEKKNADFTEGLETCDFTQDLEDINTVFNQWIEDNQARLDEIKELKWENKWFITLPDQIQALRELEGLRLYSNKLLKEIPDSISELSELRELSLIGNRLTSLPDTIGNLINLRYLIISRSGLGRLPDSLGNLSQLKFLNISTNRLMGLPESLLDLQQLEYFYLNKNPFGNLGEIEDIIKQLPSLRVCDFHPKQTTSSLKGFQMFGMTVAAAALLSPIFFSGEQIVSSVSHVARFFFNETNPYLTLSEDWILA